MSIGKVVRNAGSHRILHALSIGAKSSKELKNIVGAINSVSRFDGEYMMRMVSSGYVRQVDAGWVLTRRGQQKLEELGPATGMRDKNHHPSSPMHQPIYEPSKHNAPMPVRPGSLDFLNYPSRMGNRLIYRDGTVKEIKNGY